MQVVFRYVTGLEDRTFDGARLGGSWDRHGRRSEGWTFFPMREGAGIDGCPVFELALDFPEDQVDVAFDWGVVLDGPGGMDLWGIATEVADHLRTDRVRTFVLQAGSPRFPQVEEYYLTQSRRLGAQRDSRPHQRFPGLRFSVWAPQARQVDLVFGGPSGYIADDGSGADPQTRPVGMWRGRDGVWVLDADALPHLADFRRHVGRGYMYRIVNAEGRVVWRTDLYSRAQAGHGAADPGGRRYGGGPAGLDGAVSCSLVVDPDQAREADGRVVSCDDFWASEYRGDRPVPQRVEDLVIYELHVGALAYGEARAGNFDDAVAFLDHLAELGVNAVELLPVAEFAGNASWGYGTTHFFAPEGSAGGRDGLRRFVRRAHQLGIAVLLDVVYNHFSGRAERAEWRYDADAPDRNLYYWYEGRPGQYRSPDGGYLDNGSTGWAPRLWDEMVRKLFVSSAVAMVDECHVDGFRVDLTNALHRDNRLHADGKTPVASANLFGAKLLRELTRTLRLISPDVLLIAEDHSDWAAVTEPADAKGLGFDAAWDASFYHHLIGDARSDPGYARLLHRAAREPSGPLPMRVFAGALARTGAKKVVYHESHDEAGNSFYRERDRTEHSRRTLPAAVDAAPLYGRTLQVAEARVRVVAGLSLLSAGTPMFLMGEEVGAELLFRAEGFLDSREDLLGKRHRGGAALFRYYQDVIRLRRTCRALRSTHLEVLAADDAARVIAFRRWDGVDEMLVVASLSEELLRGFRVERGVPDGRWKEVLSSDSRLYGGENQGNLGLELQATGGGLELTVPARGLVVLRREG